MLDSAHTPRHGTSGSHRRTRWLAGLLGAALFLTTSCGGTNPTATEPGGAPVTGGLDAIVAAAKDEGKLTWYSGYTPGKNKEVAAAFKAKYGIEVETLRLASADLTQRYPAEVDAGAVVADVLLEVNPFFMKDGADKGWFREFDADALPALTDWPQDYWYGSYAAVMSIPWGFSYNTDLIGAGDAPKTWEDLLDPSLRGKILYTDPRPNFAILTNAYFWQQTFGDDYLEAFGRQEPVTTPSLVPGLQQVSAGEKAVLVQSIPGADAELVAKGAPLSTVIPPDSTGFDQYLAVSEKAPHPNAAALFLNFLMTPEGQQVLTSGSAIATLPDISGAVPTPEKFVRMDTDEVAAAKDRVLGLLDLPAA